MKGKKKLEKKENFNITESTTDILSDIILEKDNSTIKNIKVMKHMWLNIMIYIP